MLVTTRHHDGLVDHLAKDESVKPAARDAWNILSPESSPRGLMASSWSQLGPSTSSSSQESYFHDLRHTAITHLVRLGADVEQVQRFAGHAKASITRDLTSASSKGGR
jgi:integrase